LKSCGESVDRRKGWKVVGYCWEARWKVVGDALRIRETRLCVFGRDERSVRLLFSISETISNNFPTIF
jgi:hypothetical protein